MDIHNNNSIRIRPMEPTEISVCVQVIRESFSTVAQEFGITYENAPRFTAFATNNERLSWQLNQEKRIMMVAVLDCRIVGYYSLCKVSENSWELNNLAVLPSFRHHGIGGKLLANACSRTKERGGTLLKIGIVEENLVLRNWYEAAGFVHTGTQKYDFFPFTCGYMEKIL